MIDQKVDSQRHGPRPPRHEYSWVMYFQIFSALKAWMIPFSFFLELSYNVTWRSSQSVGLTRFQSESFESHH